MPRKRHVDKRREDLPEGIENLLATGEIRTDDGRPSLVLLRLKLAAFNRGPRGPRSELAEIWRELRPEIMRSYRGKRTKPWACRYLEDKP